MAINPGLLNRLEEYGLTNQHLEQLLSVCLHGPGQAVWHIDKEGYFSKIEMTLFAYTRDTRSMRNLTQLLGKDR
jgi:hypothetical protein